ncbi:hypothetical protein Ari01nite_33610 [Paractinoplanes rishiriensis]|uniref:Uncharacterized protein n=1 Tax=Paractinoplanes rishiriensis TaxID=1050105 RepID=A0A919JVD2_9ACTN|nr:hypothetical protein Ari01nite_33610 [Actinoplanes rishiriensis]
MLCQVLQVATIPTARVKVVDFRIAGCSSSTRSAASEQLSKISTGETAPPNSTPRAKAAPAERPAAQLGETCAERDRMTPPAAKRPGSGALEHFADQLRVGVDVGLALEHHCGHRLVAAGGFAH